MIELIEQKIKELYGSKASFCDLHGHKYKDFASTMNKDVKDADRIEDLAGALASGITDKETVEWLCYILEPEQANYSHYRLGIETEKRKNYENI